MGVGGEGGGGEGRRWAAGFAFGIYSGNTGIASGALKKKDATEVL